MGTKTCKQCNIEKDIQLFRMVSNKYTGIHPMSICKECYKSNQEIMRQKQAAEWEALNAELLKKQQEERQRREEYEERERQIAEEQQVRQQALEAWYLQQPDRRCIDCKHLLNASAFGYSFLKEIDGVWLPSQLHKRCKPCHEAYRDGSRQSRPLCLLCDQPANRSDFLHTYHGYRLDLIKVCCKQCIPRFNMLSEHEQLGLLHKAMVIAYGKTAEIYALQYDDLFPCQHIGRTKNYQRRMAEYQRDWYRDIQHHFILQQVSFGPLSMEYESRWMMHALKYGWPIDNFALFKGGDDGLSGQRQQEQLTRAVHVFEPLTAPFEVVGPLIREYFMNTCDTEIVNWYCSQGYCNAYPSESEMTQRLTLMQRLHRLRV